MKQKKAAKFDIDSSNEGIKLLITINGKSYIFENCHIGEALYEALDSHIENNYLFSPFISVVSLDSDAFPYTQIYAPALLCGFGFYTITDLTSHLMDTIEEDEDAENNKDETNKN